jgi:hypothetical protein
VRTVAEAITERVEAFCALLRRLLLEHSSEPRDMNTPDSPVLIVGGSYAWGKLDDEGRRLQSRLLDEHRRLAPLVRALLRSAPADAYKKLEDGQGLIEDLIDQSHLTFYRSRQDALAAAERELDRQLALLADLYDAGDNDAVYVPDTNALLWNTDLEQWAFAETPRFTIVLTPAVLGELDRLKIEHRNPDVRAKAEGLIKRIHSYRERGELWRGVPLRRGRSTIRTVAIEPKVHEALPWLDPASEDDRILAAFIEVMREHPRTLVVLVTRDVNLQNKAEYAGLPFAPPPDRTSAAA